MTEDLLVDVYSVTTSFFFNHKCLVFYSGLYVSETDKITGVCHHTQDTGSRTLVSTDVSSLSPASSSPPPLIVIFASRKCLVLCRDLYTCRDIQKPHRGAHRCTSTETLVKYYDIVLT